MVAIIGGTLEIYSDSADCVTGRLTDLDFGLRYPAFELDGDFLAARCGG